MKKVVLFIIIVFVGCLSTYADGVTKEFTVYPQFKPAIIHLTNGKTIRQPLANIFLKNSSLLYINGAHTMEAEMSVIQSVEFDDRTYVKIDTLLAYKVDSVGQNALYCVTLLDLKAYQSLLKNNKQLTNISMGGSLMQTTSIDLEDQADIELPVIDKFFYLYNGKFVYVHERVLLRTIPKDKRNIFYSIIDGTDFSWNKADCLLKLLQHL